MPSLSGQIERSLLRRQPLRHIAAAEGSAPLARRVLLADPCGDTVESTAWLLRLWGHDVRGIRTGREILEVARAYRPDTILMEIALPGLDGCEVARRLRQQAVGSEVLLVAVTGYGDQKHRRRSREAGFDWHLVKPVGPEVLQSLLATNSQDAGGR
jgi:CheY-like chemotaxis protein